MGRPSLAEQRSSEILDALERCVLRHGLAGPMSGGLLAAGAGSAAALAFCAVFALAAAASLRGSSPRPGLAGSAAGLTAAGTHHCV